MSEATTGNQQLETATPGTGCFWCTEAIFQQLQGVISVTSGYSGGHVVNPTYEQVCSKKKKLKNTKKRLIKAVHGAHPLLPKFLPSLIFILQKITIRIIL